MPRSVQIIRLVAAPCTNCGGQVVTNGMHRWCVELGRACDWNNDAEIDHDDYGSERDTSFGFVTVDESELTDGVYIDERAVQI